MESKKDNVDLSEGFDPCSLIETVKRIAPELPGLPDALRNCGSGAWESRAYVRYSLRGNENQPMAGPVPDILMVDHKDLGQVIIRFTMDNRTFGIEFVDKIPFDLD